LKNIEWVNPEFLFLLLLLPLLAWWFMRHHKTYFAPIRFSNLEALKGKSSLRGRLRAFLPVFRGLGFCFFVVALARPQKLMQETDVQTEGIDIVFSIDVSGSMLSKDFLPDRLEAAKKLAADFVFKRPTDRIGLVIFGGEAFTQCPLTTDHDMVRQFLSELKCGFLQDGTAIGMGLAAAVNRLKDSPTKSKIVILITDGKNKGGYFQPDIAAKLAKALGIKVYTIGVGTKGEAISPIARREDGTYVFGLAPVDIDEELLDRIARQTNGKYHRATNTEEFEKIYAEIDRLEKSTIDVTRLKQRSEAFAPLVGLGLFFLVLEILLRYSVFRTIP
jgi:Ca-activated chloride channel homolog